MDHVKSYSARARATTQVVVMCTAVLIAAVVPSMATAADVAARNYQNCTALNRDFPHGVGKPGAVDHVSGSTQPVRNYHVSRTLYNANSGKDRDHDKIACEKL